MTPHPPRIGWFPSRRPPYVWERSPSTVFRWIQRGFLRPRKERCGQRIHVDLAELPKALRKAGLPGPKPFPRSRDAEDQ